MPEKLCEQFEFGKSGIRQAWQRDGPGNRMRRPSGVMQRRRSQPGIGDTTLGGEMVS